MEVIDLGLSEYLKVRELQAKLICERIAYKRPDTLIFCEHPLVVTCGKNLTEAQLTKARIQAKNIGADFQHVSRGGKTTIHLPGMLMVYPVINLKEKGLGVKRFISMTLDNISQGLADLGLAVTYREELPGLWTREEPSRKIASVGLRFERGVSDHGFSFNVDCDLSKFKYFDPCGIDSRNYANLVDCSNGLVTIDKLKELIERVFEGDSNQPLGLERTLSA